MVSCSLHSNLLMLRSLTVDPFAGTQAARDRLRETGCERQAARDRLRETTERSQCGYCCRLVQRVNRLDLDVDQLSVLLAIIILSPDRDNLVEKDRVSQLQHMMLPVSLLVSQLNYTYAAS